MKFLRDAIFSNSSAGRLILLNLQYSQLEAGIGESLLEHPTIPVPYLTPSWILSVREFISKHNMSITLTEQPTITTATPSDQFIMQTNHLQRYSVGQQKDINLVRIYLQVSALADMTDTSHPNRILGSYLDGIRSSTWTATMRWPRQAASSLSQRRLWKRYIVSSFLRYAPYWKQNPTLKSPRSHSVFLESSAPPHIPDTGIKMSLMEYLKTLPRTQRRMVTDVQQVATDVQIWRAFRSHERLQIASDGGLSGHDGTFGLVLATTKQVLFKCGGPVDGPFDTASSTRSELCGFASSSLLIAAVARNWGLRHRCSFRWLTDSRSALSKVYKTNRRGCTASRQPFDSDLLSMIRSLLIEIRRVVTFKWVKGHQDSLVSYEKLPRAARLNIDADFLATRYRLRGKSKSTRHIDHCPEQRVSISILGVRLTSQYDECIRYHINGYHLKQYMQDRKQWNEATWNMIDTGQFGQHFKRLTSSQQITHMKVVHDQLPLGIRRYQRSQSKDETLKTCPCCTNEDETSQHLWRCKENSFMETGLLALRRSGTGGPHPLLKILTGGIMHWIDTDASDFSTDVGDYPIHMQETLARILGEQEQIGWENALKGFLSKSWLDLASMQYDDDRYDKTAGLQRLQQCIKALYTYTEGIWRTRNSALHDSDDQFRQRLRSNMHDTITHFYNNPDKICFDDEYLCGMSLQSLLRSSSATQRRWIKRMRDSREMHRRMGERQTLITSYFRRDK